jgi:magnesium-transporting ATPase (P-type)
MSSGPEPEIPDRRPTPIWHALTAAETLARLDSHPEQGLGSAAAAARLAESGPNRLPAPRRRSAALRLALQFHNPLIHVLLAAGAITLALDDYLDAGVILGVVLINAAICFVHEGRAERALEAVRALLASRATAIRDGRRQVLDAAELVPGDLVLLEPGDRVPADLRLLATRDLHLDEAALTGESLPVNKTAEPVAAAAAVGDRRCLAHAGTLVTRGQGRGLVVTTGAATEIGRIGALVAAVGDLATPLTRRLDGFARRITGLILVAGALVFGYGHYVRGLPLLDTFLVVVGLAVAAIPEGLPAIVTITLAIGTRAMARRHAVVRRLPAVEALGSVTLICSDKTGTLTRNQMTVVQVLLAGRELAVSGAGYAPEGGFEAAGRPVDPAADDELRALARCALLCNDARLHRDPDTGDWQLAGDPTEGALLTLALKCGLDPAAEQRDHPRLDAIPFAAERRFMATLHHDHKGGSFVLLKGAPETVLALCSRGPGGSALDPAAWEERMAAVAAMGARLLALARLDLEDAPAQLAFDAIRPGFTLLGAVAMLDPPRPEAIAAVAECRRAGIRTLMITGDHAVTAAALGA